MQFGLLMNKLNDNTNLIKLSELEIDFLTGNANLCPPKLNSKQSIFPPIPDDFLQTNIISWKSTKNNSTLSCLNCHTDEFVIKDQFGGIFVCTSCGQVINSLLLDSGPEWKSFDGKSSDRCGLPTNALLPQSSLGTTIGGNCNFKLKTLQNWSLMPYKERSMNEIFEHIHKKCSSIGLLKCIVDDAKIMFKIAMEYKMPNKTNNLIVRQKNKTGLIAASVYYACKRRKQTKSIKEISGLFEITPACLNKGCKFFTRYVKYKNVDYNTNLSHPSQYIKQICEKLKFDKKTTQEIMNIVLNIQNTNMMQSHTPISIASACVLLFASNKSLSDITKHSIAEAIGISEVTIIKTYNKLCEYKDVLFGNKTIIKTNETTKSIDIQNKLNNKLIKIKLIDVSKYNNNTQFTINKHMNIDVLQYNIDQCHEFVSYRNINHTQST